MQKLSTGNIASNSLLHGFKSPEDLDLHRSVTMSNSGASVLVNDVQPNELHYVGTMQQVQQAVLDMYDGNLARAILADPELFYPIARGDFVDPELEASRQALSDEIAAHHRTATKLADRDDQIADMSNALMTLLEPRLRALIDEQITDAVADKIAELQDDLEDKIERGVDNALDDLHVEICRR